MTDKYVSHTSDWTQNWNGSIAIKLISGRLINNEMESARKILNDFKRHIADL